jgi:hypothetical protein
MRARTIVMSTTLLCAVLAAGAGQPASQPNPHAPTTPAMPAGHPQVPGAPKADNEPGKQPEPRPIPPAKPEDVASVDAIVKAFFASTAGAAGQPRNWDRFRSLFVGEARMIVVRHATHGQEGLDLITLPVDGFIEANKNYFEKGGFFEKEVARRSETFGNMAQVWSTYESRRNEKDKDPYVRGVYSMQLAFNGERWFLINVMWDTEQEGVKLPDKYLKTPAE